MQILSSQDVLSVLKQKSLNRPYRIMYSSYFGGYVTDPALMFVPLDEHMVHRGDGVFEAIRTTNKTCYLLEPHLDRLFLSAKSIGLEVPMSKGDVKNICENIRKHMNQKEGALRIFVGRGPGDYSPNPYTTIGSQIYIVGMDFKAMPEEKFEKGVSLMVSKIPVKPSPFSQIKSLNYLQNVLMKKESVDQGYDFSLGLNEDGFIAEGPTENIMMVTREGVLTAPRFDYTLRGTTLIRVFELAKKLGIKTEVRDISIDELASAKEVMMVGTTLEVLPVTRIENEPVSHGLVGEISRKLRAELHKDLERSE